MAIDIRESLYGEDAGTHSRVKGDVNVTYVSAREMVSRPVLLIYLSSCALFAIFFPNML